MAEKLKVSIEQLKAIVEMTGVSGEWQDKGNGHWQFRCNDNAILNWWKTSGTISYQGPQTERQEFEQIVELAIEKSLSGGAAPSMSSCTGSEPHEPLPVQPIPLGRYRHYKGNEYEVIGVARHSETLEEFVVYRALYGDHGLWLIGLRRSLDASLSEKLMQHEKVDPAHSLPDLLGRHVPTQMGVATEDCLPLPLQPAGTGASYTGAVVGFPWGAAVQAMQAMAIYNEVVGAKPCRQIADISHLKANRKSTQGSLLTSHGDSMRRDVDGINDEALRTDEAGYGASAAAKFQHTPSMPICADHRQRLFQK